MHDSPNGINHWWGERHEDVGDTVVGTLSEIREDQRWRITLAKQEMAAYHGCDVNHIGPNWVNRHQESTSVLNTVRRIVDTGVAKIASKQRPKASLLSSGGDYKQRLTCKKLSKFCEAQLHLPQGAYSSSWQLQEQTFKDSEIWGTGVTMVYPDLNRQKIVHERRFQHDMFFDEQDSEHGTPSNLFTYHKYDRYTLAERFPKSKEAILAAAAYDDFTELGDYRRKADMVAVYQGIRLPFGKDKPGRMVIAVNSPESFGGRNVLVDQKWELDSFPCVFQYWKPPTAGMWGTSLVSEIVAIQKYLDEMFGYLQENAQLQSSGIIFYDPAALYGGAKSLEGNEAFKKIAVRNPSAVNVVTPPPFHPALVEWMHMLRSATYEMSGINETTSQGRKEPGLDSGVALRSMNDLQSEIFLPQARAHEDSFRELARKDLDAANQLHDAGVKLSLALPDEGFLGTIDFDEIRMPSDMYTVTIQSSNSLENSLAGRRQQIMELGQAKALGGDELQRLLLSPNPDLEHQQSLQNAQFEYIEQLIAEFQEADEGDNVFTVPDPLLDLDLAIHQMTLGYHEMLRMKAPDYNKELAREWIRQAHNAIAKIQADAQKKMQEQQAGMAGAGPAAPPMGGPPQGGPPMPPGPPAPPQPPPGPQLVPEQVAA